MKERKKGRTVERASEAPLLPGRERASDRLGRAESESESPVAAVIPATTMKYCPPLRRPSPSFPVYQGAAGLNYLMELRFFSRRTLKTHSGGRTLH